jgi:hypothetical protein
MSQNTGKGFEELTQRVFQALHDQQDARNVRVERDVSLTGVSGVSRKIDVYWEFELGGVTHRVIVECKDWVKAVDLEVVTALLGTLSDLPGHLGAIVSRNGFQDGARRLAEAHRIVLYELRTPRDQDWKGFITGVNITITLRTPKLHEVQVPPDQEWLAKEWDRIGIPANEPITMSGEAGDMHLQREDGSALTTVGDIVEDHLLPKEVGPPEWREYVFSEPAYVVTGRNDLPRIKLRAVRARTELTEGTSREVQVRLNAFVALILKEVTKGTLTVLDDEGRPLAPGQPRPARLIASDDDAESDDQRG